MIMPAYNERFCEIAGVFPQKRYREFATASPAATSVNPATSQSRFYVTCHMWKVRTVLKRRKMKKKKQRK